MIIHLVGPVSDTTRLIADSLRNSQIGQAKGCLLVHDGAGGEPIYMIEKLIAADIMVASSNSPLTYLTPGTKAKDIKWKKEPMVILVNDRIALLDEFEKLAPGFNNRLGPVVTLTISSSVGEG